MEHRRLRPHHLGKVNKDLKEKPNPIQVIAANSQRRNTRDNYGGDFIQAVATRRTSTNEESQRKKRRPGVSQSQVSKGIVRNSGGGFYLSHNGRRGGFLPLAVFWKTNGWRIPENKRIGFLNYCCFPGIQGSGNV